MSAASRYDLPSVTQAPSPWGEGRGLRGTAALVCGIEVSKLSGGLFAAFCLGFGEKDYHMKHLEII
jgi:hypothetical protein